MDTTLAAGRPSLPAELHAATRSEHATLNRTIIARLPLCLPTATSTPDLYAQGMTVFSQIYFGFEDAWDTLLADKIISQRQREMLEQLDVPYLRRRRRLEESLQQLITTSSHTSAMRLSSVRVATSHFRDEIRQAILDKPHLLLAYTWTMYLALFNGGRWIAKQLLGAGSPFWRSTDRATVVSGALSSWFFGDTEDYDGDDIKVAFKERFDCVATALTVQERKDVVEESKRIFQTCAGMITFLDQNVQSGEIKQGMQLPAAVCPYAMQQTATGTSNLVASPSPSSFAGLWRCIANVMPSQKTFSVPLWQEIKQEH